MKSMKSMKLAMLPPNHVTKFRSNTFYNEIKDEYNEWVKMVNDDLVRGVRDKIRTSDDFVYKQNTILIKPGKTGTIHTCLAEGGNAGTTIATKYVMRLGKKYINTVYAHSYTFLWIPFTKEHSICEILYGMLYVDMVGNEINVDGTTYVIQSLCPYIHHYGGWIYYGHVKFNVYLPMYRNQPELNNSEKVLPLYPYPSAPPLVCNS